MEQNRSNAAPLRALAAVMLVAMFGTGYAISTRVESDAAMDTPAVAAAATTFEYFPAQYVNQGQTLEPHIQAF